jgi:hypothetical protein
MRPLDRLFGHLAYPLDVLVPSALWLLVAGALLAAACRRRRAAAAFSAVLALLNVIGWSFGFGMRMLADGAVTPWVAAVEAPFGALRAAVREALWQAVGVMAAPDPAWLFRGYSSWNGHWSVLLAGLLNESAALALAATGVTLIAAAAGRAAR